jgi:8-oxo-dGTP pyrophosphatase MutT (NUDIX family)
MSLATLDTGSLRDLAALRLHVSPPPFATRGDHDLNPDTAHEMNGGRNPVPAAVLVPLVARAAGLTVLLTQRTSHLAAHAGQVAFPGGKVDAGDAGPLAAALREAEEEIGLARRFVEPLGYLDLYTTGTGFSVAPTVALVTEGFTLNINPGEVAQTFEVPLAFLMDPANHQRQSREWRGKLRHFYAMPYQDHFIWGATAGMIRNLYETLSSP